MSDGECFDYGRAENELCPDDEQGMIVVKKNGELVAIRVPENLDDLFYQLHLAKESLDYELENVNELIKILELKKAAIIERFPEIPELEKTIVDEVKVLGKPFSCQYGDAKYKKGYERVTWDSKALSGYAAAHEEIEKFKKIANVEPTVTITTGYKL